MFTKPVEFDLEKLGKMPRYSKEEEAKRAVAMKRGEKASFALLEPYLAWSLEIAPRLKVDLAFEDALWEVFKLFLEISRDYNPQEEVLLERVKKRLSSKFELAKIDFIRHNPEDIDRAIRRIKRELHLERGRKGWGFRTVTKISLEKEVKLAAIIKRGEVAKKELALSVLGWAVKRALKTGRTTADPEDLLSDFFYGIMLSLRTFDPTKGRLTTHVSWQFMRMGLLAGTAGRRLIKVPQYYLWGANEVGDETLRNQILQSASVSSISAEQQKWEGSLIEGGLSELELRGNQVEERKKILREVMGILSLREREVLSLRLEGWPLWLVGDKLGVTRERVRQIETKVILKVKDWLRDKDPTSVETSTVEEPVEVFEGIPGRVLESLLEGEEALENLRAEINKEKSLIENLKSKLTRSTDILKEFEGCLEGIYGFVERARKIRRFIIDSEGETQSESPLVDFLERKEENPSVSKRCGLSVLGSRPLLGLSNGQAASI